MTGLLSIFEKAKGKDAEISLKAVLSYNNYGL